MESTIDFLCFRLCEREDFIAFSPIPGAMLSPPSATVKRNSLEGRVLLHPCLPCLDPERSTKSHENKTTTWFVRFVGLRGSSSLARHRGGQVMDPHALNRGGIEHTSASQVETWR